MAGQPPDPRSLDSWEDAFQYPLPVVRKLEQQLRKNIDENRQKLRSLVGASYRDLLGTAERIIEMDGQTQNVESNLGDIGRKCNAGRVVKIGENHERMRMVREGRDRERYQAMAQTKVLQNCLTTAQRTMRGGGDALVVAKVLVLARLLHKSVSESGGAPGILEDLRRKLASLRKKLVSYIDRSLLKASSENDALAHSLAAYALVTSSSAKDVLRHFLNIHLERIETEADNESNKQSAVLELMDFFKETLQSTRAVFPRAFTDAIARLSEAPLLRDPQITGLTELNIDLYGGWIAEEVQSFTPWLRHESISVSEVQAALKSWSVHAQNMLLGVITICIEAETDYDTVVSVRRAVILRYMAMASLHDNKHISGAIRDVAAATQRRLGEVAVRTMEAGSDLFDKLSHDSASPSPTSDLWSLASQDFDLHSGTTSFRTAILRKQHGRSPGLQAICQNLDSWVENLERLSQSIQQLRTVKWHSELEIDLDDLEDSDALVGELNKDDPDELLVQFRSAASQVLNMFYNKIEISAQTADDPATVLRALRELKWRDRALRDLVGASKEDDHRTVKLISNLHHALAVGVSKDALALWSFERGRKHSVATTLWDGSPALPVQPSPATFKILTTLHQRMADAGHDLWTARAVDSLKTSLDAELAASLVDVAQSTTASASTTNGHAHNEDHKGHSAEPVANEASKSESSNVVSVESDQQQPHFEREQQIQLVFDMLYLSRSLQRHESSKSNEKSLHGQASVLSRHLDLEQSSHERLAKSADEYWKRTYLLFGLLADSKNS